jgi:hypothetical protein
MGTVGILNVGAGDTKLVFDTANPDEVANSARVVRDMIRRGFVLLVEVGRDDKGPLYRRAHDFDEATAEYIIAGPPPAETETKSHEQKSAKPARVSRQGKAPADRRTRIKASSTNAVAVARTAGG